jgi:putative NADPH-quinone reductase
MSKHILLVQGHPDANQHHLCNALERAYEKGANSAKHTVRHIDVAALDFPILRSQQEWEYGNLPSSLKQAQSDILWAEHIVFFFPLWLGDMPALLKGFLEQVARPNFAFVSDGNNPYAEKTLLGRSARVVVTMGMPALVYRWYFRAHSIKSLERNILGFVGIKPVDETLIGSVAHLNDKQVKKWLNKMEKLGESGS